jgi:hypothetical protein
MKKILLITFLIIGISNIAWASFFDSTCDAVEAKHKEISKDKKRYDVLVEQMEKDHSKVELYSDETWELDKGLFRNNEQLEKLCKEVQFQCKEECAEFKERHEESERRKKSNEESFKRAMKMLKSK